MNGWIWIPARDIGTPVIHESRLSGRHWNSALSYGFHNIFIWFCLLSFLPWTLFCLWLVFPLFCSGLCVFALRRGGLHWLFVLELVVHLCLLHVARVPWHHLRCFLYSGRFCWRFVSSSVCRLRIGSLRVRLFLSFRLLLLFSLSLCNALWHSAVMAQPCRAY